MISKDDDCIDLTSNTLSTPILLTPSQPTGEQPILTIKTVLRKCNHHNVLFNNFISFANNLLKF